MIIRRLKKLKAQLDEHLPESRLSPLSAKEIARLKKRFPNIPVHLMEFFELIGCGTVGTSRYMIYDLHSPDGIFDDETAANLQGIVLIGDDFSGHHEAYDTKNKWRFGTVGSGGSFQPYKNYATVVDFLEVRFAEG